MCRINLSNHNTADVKVLTDTVQKEVEAIRTIIIDGTLQDQQQDIDNLLCLYESCHVLNVLPQKWSKEHLFKCNCTMHFQRTSCQHVLLAVLGVIH